jgi:transposase-like protein/Zn ribbon nucleic-acid-binding protein
MSSTEHYPRHFQEFLDQFKCEDDCWNYIYEIRWPNGFVCPKCREHNKYWLTDHKLIHCSYCGHQTSVTGGTIFHGTRKPLLLWFHIMWWVVAQKTGASANNLMDFMGFGSYETAWSWLQKLRRAMVRPERDRLSGEVEVDETYIGGKEIGKGKQGRGAEAKTLVIVATECIGKQIGRVRFKCIPDSTREYLMQFIKENIEPGSTIITDGWSGYNFLIGSKKYNHEIKAISRSGKEALELLPHVHMVDSLVKRWINGTHQGRISPKYLSYYLDEFAFRFNRKLSTYRGKLFYRLMQQAVDTPPQPLKEILKST